MKTKAAAVARWVGFRTTDLAAPAVTMRGTTRFPLYFLKEPWLTSCQGKARNLRGQVFFSSLTNLFSKQAFFSLREILLRTKEKGEGGGERAANPKKIKFINFLYKKSKIIYIYIYLFMGKKGKSSHISRKKKGRNL
jgi:hypothetical protein